MRMIKTAIITGATGAIGQALCRLLVKENVKIYAFVSGRFFPPGLG